MEPPEQESELTAKLARSMCQTCQCIRIFLNIFFYLEFHLPGYNAMNSREIQQIFRRKVLPPSSWPGSKPGGYRPVAGNVLCLFIDPEDGEITFLINGR